MWYLPRISVCQVIISYKKMLLTAICVISLFSKYSVSGLIVGLVNDAPGNRWLMFAYHL